MNLSRRRTLAALSALILPKTSLSAPSAAPLALVTSDLPPMTMSGDPGQRGVLMDLVEAMLKLADLPAQPEFVPWARAMLRATEQPRTLIVPLNRTPDRETRFQWLVKLYAQRFAFITLAGKPRIATIEQARRLRIAALRGSSNLDALRQQGVQMRRVYHSTGVDDMQRALQRGLVDAMYGSELIHTDSWRRNGYDPAQLQTGLVLESADIWLAAHRGITEAEQARLQKAHDALLADGSAERIFKRYGLKMRAETSP
ncbi:substrate-binding periplasmic protein [Roseateles sp. DC23W]|uniref:Substrate-binding periplasmic protein n=1 Tax=Pelomonas dachongensis TaxID=3299029 RepID=A0ABW7EU35_9BURK